MSKLKEFRERLEERKKAREFETNEISKDPIEETTKNEEDLIQTFFDKSHLESESKIKIKIFLFS